MQELDKTVVLRVLIAEDEQFQRESLEAMFKSANSSLFGSIYFRVHACSEKGLNENFELRRNHSSRSQARLATVKPYPRP